MLTLLSVCKSKFWVQRCVKHGVVSPITLLFHLEDFCCKLISLICTTTCIVNLNILKLQRGNTRETEKFLVNKYCCTFYKVSLYDYCNDQVSNFRMLKATISHNPRGKGESAFLFHTCLVSLISNIRFSTSSFNNIKHYSKEMFKDISGILNEFLNMVSVHLKHLIDNTSLQHITNRNCFYQVLKETVQPFLKQQFCLLLFLSN